MARIAMFFGVALILLGIVLYALADPTGPHGRSPTALIPSVFGLALFLLGLVARAGSDKARMHTMHLAAVIGLVGLVFPAYRAIAALVNDGELNLVVVGELVMAGLCGLFLVLCIKSFIDARIARKRNAAAVPPPAGEVK